MFVYRCVLQERCRILDLFLKSNNHKNVSVKLSSHASALLRALEVTQRDSPEIYNKQQFGQEDDDTSFIIHSRGTHKHLS